MMVRISILLALLGALDLSLGGWGESEGGDGGGGGDWGLWDRKDPVKDFCRRWGHATVVVDGQLFVNGGKILYNPITDNKHNRTSRWLLYHDLNNTEHDMPKLVAGDDSKKNRSIPSTTGGVLWGDDVNKFLFQFGGESWRVPKEKQLWEYDVLTKKWNGSDLPDKIDNVAWGAGVSVQERGEGYLLGGWMNNKTDRNRDGDPVLSNGLIRFDMVSRTFENSSLPDGIGKAEGTMVYIPASDAGMLIHFGGIIEVSENGSMVGAPMDTIWVYDLGSSQWYSQKAAGDVPENRRLFCGGASWADDRSSYNIYIYGGLGIPPNGVGFDDVYILSLPSFTWIKWWPTAPGPGRPHHSTTCNVINRGQMIIIGGQFPMDDDCDAPDKGGSHTLNLGANGPNRAQWDAFNPNVSMYQVPQEIMSRIGGGTSGGATVVQPKQWDNRDLPVYFSRRAQFPTREPTRKVNLHDSPPKSKNTSKLLGVVLGSVFGGLAVLIVVLAMLLCYLKARKTRLHAREKHPSEVGSSHPRIELPADGASRASGLADPKPAPHAPVFELEPKGNSLQSQSSTHTASPIGGPPPVTTADVAGHGHSPAFHHAPVYAAAPRLQVDLGGQLPGVYPLGPYYPGTHMSSGDVVVSPQSGHPESAGVLPGSGMANPVAEQQLLEGLNPTSQCPTPAYFYAGHGQGKEGEVKGGAEER